MKKTAYYFLSIIAIIVAVACNEGIDPISRVEPGADQAPPAVTITYPTEGTSIQVLGEIATIGIQFEATDDIELQSVAILMDGNEIKNYTQFRDYRRLVAEYVYDNVTNGVHVLTVTATDLSGKITSQNINFQKVSAYTPKYEGEVLYLPFDGDMMDLVSFTTATKIGNPGFSEDKIVGTNSYAGAADAYLTFPTAGILGNEFSAIFWYKLNATPDRAGILEISPVGDDRAHGLRFAREADGANQKFFLNIGDGAAETWIVPPSFAVSDEWMHVAISISTTHASVYINGNIVAESDFGPINWEGCDLLSFASGMPRFVYWDHFSDLSLYDELRIFNKALSTSDIQHIIEVESNPVEEYTPKYDGEIFYMPFDGENKELVSGTDPTVIGTPGFAGEGKQGGDAYAGATDSYLEFPTTSLTNSEFSAVFWMKLNIVPERAGILTMSPVDEAHPDAQNNRTNGFRFFRENVGGKQRFKLNVGNGTEDTWFDGGSAADVDPAITDWIHFAFTISSSECVFYINGQVASQASFTGVGWTGCDVLTIMSGNPRFTEWEHYSDLSFLDELRIFDKALTQTEIQTIIDAENAK